MNGSKPYSPAASAARQGETIPTARCSGLFPLTPALSLEERVNPAPRGGQSSSLGFPRREARCSLSLRERVRVRGNGAAAYSRYRTIRGTVELDESSGEAGGFQMKMKNRTPTRNAPRRETGRGKELTIENYELRNGHWPKPVRRGANSRLAQNPVAADVSPLQLN